MVQSPTKTVNNEKVEARVGMLGRQGEISFHIIIYKSAWAVAPISLAQPLEMRFLRLCWRDLSNNPFSYPSITDNFSTETAIHAVTPLFMWFPGPLLLR